MSHFFDFYSFGIITSPFSECSVFINLWNKKTGRFHLWKSKLSKILNKTVSWFIIWKINKKVSKQNEDFSCTFLFQKYFLNKIAEFWNWLFLDMYFLIVKQRKNIKKIYFWLKSVFISGFKANMKKWTNNERITDWEKTKNDTKISNGILIMNAFSLFRKKKQKKILKSC